MNTTYSETYDCQAIRYYTRKQAAFYTATLFASLTLFPGGAAFLIEHSYPLFLVVLVVAGCCICSGYCLYKIYEFRAMIWGLKLNADQIKAYNYVRQTLDLSWTEITDINVSASGITITGADRQRLVLPESFHNFTEAAHTLVCRAEENNIPVLVEGTPWEVLDVQVLFPFIRCHSPGLPTFNPPD